MGLGVSVKGITKPRDINHPLLDHINSLDHRIKFTNDSQKGGCLPFLDTFVTCQADGSVKVSKYHKPTHTDQ